MKTADDDDTMPIVVAVEGPNGSGKSTVARHLASILDGRIVRYPEAFLQFRAEQGLDEFPAIPRLLYYLAGIAQLSETIAGRDSAVVCDRYFASPIALLVAEQSLNEEQILRHAGPLLDSIVMPHITLLLSADHRVLRQRLAMRGIERPGASMQQTATSGAFVDRWNKALRKLLSARCSTIEIDTTDTTIERMCQLAGRAVIRA